MLLLFILLRADRYKLPDIISLLSLIRKTRFSFLTVARFLFYFTWDVRFLFSFMGRAILFSFMVRAFFIWLHVVRAFLFYFTAVCVFG